MCLFIFFIARILFQLQVAFAYKHLRDIRRHMEWGDGESSSTSTTHFHKQSLTPGYPINFWDLIKIQEETQAILKVFLFHFLYKSKLLLIFCCLFIF